MVTRVHVCLHRNPQDKTEIISLTSRNYRQKDERYNQLHILGTSMRDDHSKPALPESLVDSLECKNILK